MDSETERSSLEESAKELSPHQTRKSDSLKKWKRIKKDRNSSCSDSSVEVRIGNSNSDSRYLIEDDFVNSEDWSIGSRDSKSRHVRQKWKNLGTSLNEECDSRNNNNNNNGECSVSGDNEENSEKEESNFDDDPLSESLFTLQTAQEALQREIKKFGEIGNGSLSPDDDDLTNCSSVAADVSAVDLGFNESFLSGQSSIEVKQISPSSLELQVLSLTENINILKSKSEELQGMLALKDSRIAELETTLTSDKFPKEESTFTKGLLDENFKEVESEIESLFRQKVEYLVIEKMVQDLKVASAFKLLEKQETMSGSQVQVEENRADKLEKNCDDSLGVEEAFMVQRRLCKQTFCVFLQFMLILVFWFAQSVPNSRVVVPT